MCFVFVFGILEHIKQQQQNVFINNLHQYYDTVVERSIDLYYFLLFHVVNDYCLQ